MKVGEVVAEIQDIEIRLMLLNRLEAIVSEETSGDLGSSGWSLFGPGDIKWVLAYLQDGRAELKTRMRSLKNLELAGDRRPKKTVAGPKKK